MINLYDALLPQPLPGLLYHPLEFIFFVFHFFFVLLTLGASFYAVLAIYRRLHSAEAPPPDIEHGKVSSSSLPAYFASKSLMITFGIAVLLLVLAFYSVPFTNAANLNGGAWMALIIILSAALIILEVFDRTSRGVVRHVTFWTGVAGLVLLMIVPGVFVAFVVTAENPDRWAEFFHRNVVFTSLAGHWFVRLLHVYGAAAVIAGMFYLFYSARTGRRSPATAEVLFGALMVQIVLGILLYFSMPRHPSALMNLFVIIGAGAAAGFAREMFSGKAQKGEKYLVPASLVLILIPMLLARQVYQENVLVPFNARLQQNAREFKASLAQVAPAGANRFLEEKYDPNNLPQFIFQRSCVFCHGGVGNGQGREAGNLKIPPANLTAVRTHRDSLMVMLRRGWPGSAMPYFAVYTEGALKGLTDFLYRYVGIREELEPVTVAIPAAEEQNAGVVFSRNCAVCHGERGRISPAGKALLPSPPDLSRWGLQPQEAFRIVTEGYPGTAMPSFRQFPEQTRWALVKVVNGFYGQKHPKAATGQ